jgi:hypothetical protein
MEYLMKNRVQALVTAILRDLSHAGDDLSALQYITTPELRDRIAEIIELAKRNSNDPGEWASASSRMLQATVTPGIGDAEYHAGLAAANGAGAVWYAVRGDGKVALERALAAFDAIRDAAEDQAKQAHADSEPAVRSQAVITAREHVVRAIAEVAFHALFLT